MSSKIWGQMKFVYTLTIEADISPRDVAGELMVMKGKGFPADMSLSRLSGSTKFFVVTTKQREDSSILDVARAMATEFGAPVEVSCQSALTWKIVPPEVQAEETGWPENTPESVIRERQQAALETRMKEDIKSMPVPDGLRTY